MTAKASLRNLVLLAAGIFLATQPQAWAVLYILLHDILSILNGGTR